MSPLRLFLYSVCWIVTLNLVHSTDQALWINPIPVAYRISGLELPRTGDKLAQQAVQSARFPLSRPDESFGDRTSENSQNSETFQSRQLPSPDWSSLPGTDEENLLDEQDKSKWTALEYPTFQLLGGDALRETGGSGDSIYNAVKFTNSRSSAVRISRRSFQAQNPRQIETEEGKLLPPVHSHGSRILYGLLSYPRSKPQLMDPRMVSPVALSRLHRSAHVQEAAIVLCRRKYFTCFRRHALALKRFTSQRKRNQFPSPYLLGGAMGRR